MLLDWLPAHIDAALTVGDLTRHSGMSLRTFQQRIRECTGTAPGEWLIRQRVARARHLAETTSLTVEQIATRSGFRAVETLRHHFRRLVGTTPTDYRRTFAQVRDGAEQLPPESPAGLHHQPALLVDSRARARPASDSTAAGSGSR